MALGRFPNWISRHTQRRPRRTTMSGYSGLAGRYTGIDPVKGHIIATGEVTTRPRRSRLFGDLGGFTR